MLIYIENKELLTKIISYLDYNNKEYTLDINSNYEYVVIADINKKSLEITKNKKVIFLTHLLEKKIYRVFTKNNKQNREFKRRLINNIDTFYKIIVSLEAIKRLLNKPNVEVINDELPIINLSNSKYLYEIYKIKKRKRNILFIDFNYDGLDNIYNLSLKYPKDNFIYLGFKPNYNMTKKELEKYNKLPNNIYKIKYYDFNIFCDLLKISDLVINESNIILEIKYLYAIFIMKKIFITKDNILLDELIESKYVYKYYDIKELLNKFNKVLTDRLSNITDNAYEYICDNTFALIAKKYSIYLP